MRLLHHRQQERQQKAGIVRLIGLELRIDMRYQGGMVEEVQMIPLDIEIDGMANAVNTVYFGPLTLHTSHGDVNIPQVPLPARF